MIVDKIEAIMTSPKSWIFVILLSTLIVQNQNPALFTQTLTQLPLNCSHRSTSFQNSCQILLHERPLEYRFQVKSYQESVKYHNLDTSQLVDGRKKKGSKKRTKPISLAQSVAGKSLKFFVVVQNNTIIGSVKKDFRLWLEGTFSLFFEESSQANRSSLPTRKNPTTFEISQKNWQFVTFPEGSLRTRPKMIFKVDWSEDLREVVFSIDKMRIYENTRSNVYNTDYLRDDHFTVSLFASEAYNIEYWYLKTLKSSAFLLFLGIIIPTIYKRIFRKKLGVLLGIAVTFLGAMDLNPLQFNSLEGSNEDSVLVENGIFNDYMNFRVHVLLVFVSLFIGNMKGLVFGLGKHWRHWHFMIVATLVITCFVALILDLAAFGDSYNMLDPYLNFNHIRYRSIEMVDILRVVQMVVDIGGILGTLRRGEFIDCGFLLILQRYYKTHRFRIGEPNLWKMTLDYTVSLLAVTMGLEWTTKSKEEYEEEKQAQKAPKSRDFDDIELLVLKNKEMKEFKRRNKPKSEDTLHTK